MGWVPFQMFFLGPFSTVSYNRYQVNGDFLSRETHRPMLLELLGLISEILDGYGLQ